MARKEFKTKVVKAISIGLSAYMALTPVTVYADEIEDTDNNSSEQVETGSEANDSAKETTSEAASNVKQAVEDAVTSETQINNFEATVTGFEISNIDSGNTTENTVENAFENVSENTSENTPETVEENVSENTIEQEIQKIENEAIKETIREVSDSLTAVDMTNVNDALEKVSALVNETITDETVASEIEATADKLIAIYDAQSTAALNALTDIAIVDNEDAVTVLEDGSVVVDWNAATEDITNLYQAYLAALNAKEEAQKVKDAAETAVRDAGQNVETTKGEATKKQEEIAELNNKISNEEAISKSKAEKEEKINELIDTVAASKKKSELTKGKTFDYTIKGSSDIYRFYVNTVEDGIVYGCFTYYDATNKTILRKNFSISADGKINHDYEPKTEWVKDEKTNPSGIYGNSGNYVAAYVGANTSSYINSNKFDGPKTSVIIRDFVGVNEAIDAKNDALSQLNDINDIISDAEAKLNEAETKAKTALDDYKEKVKDYEDALKKYNEAVAKYNNAASLESEIKKNEVDKAMLEYVKAEVEAWRKQQILDQINAAIDNVGTTNNTVVNTANTEEIDVTLAQENIETVVNTIAVNLGVEPAAVEEMVAQTIIETANADDITTDNEREAAVAGVRRTESDGAEVVATAEDINEKSVEEEEDTVIAAEKELTEEAVTSQDEVQEVITLEDNEIPLANFGTVENQSRKWWLPLMTAFSFITGMFLILFKKKEKEEETNE